MSRWLRPDERELVEGQGGERTELAANLLWTAKEAAAKARREGIRFDVREVRVDARGLGEPAKDWQRLEVGWTDGALLGGWWRSESGWVMAVVSEPAADSPPADLMRRASESG
jgi:4'-phosphopantetheinyl transferase